MDHNHGIAAAPFTGIVQAQRGQMERWSFTMTLRRLTRKQASSAFGFFLNLEGPLNIFRMADPAALQPLGRATGMPVGSATAAGSRTIATIGWTPNTDILRAGDWVQIGHNYSRVRNSVTSDASGAATLDLWPRIMLAVISGTPVKLRPARGLFRFSVTPPEFDISAESLLRTHEFRLAGSQEILTPALIATLES